MLIFDTNVISELTHPNCHPRVLAFANRHSFAVWKTTSVSIAETYSGIHILPEGKRKQALLMATNVLIRTYFKDRILYFDETAADAYAQMAPLRMKFHEKFHSFDGQIAAIAAVHDAILVTRNEKDFKPLGIRYVNPWSE